MPNRYALAALATLILAGCSQDATGPAPSPTAAAPALDLAEGQGAVFVLTNTVSGNAVVAFTRAVDGTLTSTGSFATGGAGSGAGLGSQGALAVTGHWLLAVNAGSNELSAFRIDGATLTLTDRVASGGTMPISVTAWNNIVYVLNAGDPGNITGFQLTGQGTLTPLAGSTRGLGGSGTGPAQVGFRPDGRVLTVTEKNSNLVVTYTVDESGLPSQPISHSSAGTTPFGFAYANVNTLVVSEAEGGAAGAASTSSYRVRTDGSLDVLSGAVPDVQSAACWVAISRDHRYAYISNAGSNSLSGYSIGVDGTLALLTPGGATAMTGAHPLDSDFSDNGRYLYVLNTVDGTVSGFAWSSDGSLAGLGATGSLPTSASGLIAR